MASVVTLMAPGAFEPQVCRYQTLERARYGYTNYDLKAAQELAQSLNRTVTMELWDRWDTNKCTRIDYREVYP